MPSSFGKILIFLFTLAIPLSLSAKETVRVTAELTPPFITADRTGYTFSLLREIEARADLRFEISILPSFERAWKLARSNQSDMVLHAALGQEETSFNQQMILSDWYLPVQPAVFYKDPKYLERFLKAVDGRPDKNLTVGLPYGNIHYGVQNLKLPNSSFKEATMDSLVKMLERGRIDLIWCMKLNVSKALERNSITGVTSTPYPAKQTIRLGAAFPNTQQGRALKAKLDKVVSSIDLAALLPDVYRYADLTD